VHRERPFFASLVKFMTEGPVIVMALEREDAVKKLREVMGATNPANAAEGHHSQALRGEHRAQLHPRIGRAGDGEELARLIQCVASGQVVRVTDPER
jgi:nucleoside-diphosphate kinase